MPNTAPLIEFNQQIRPNGTTPRVYLTSSIVSSFEAGDQRRQKWIDSITYQSVKYYYPGKYKNATTTISEYYMVLRIAEQYLIRAESNANLNNLTDAVNDIDVVRNRAGLPGLPSNLTQSQVLTAIEQERRVEFFGEWAHRWFDLKRTGRVKAVLSPLKPNFLDTDLLYPIPVNELLYNPSLTQNLGY
jgi:hypothetical protein